MPFDWMQPHRPAGRAKVDADRRASMYRAEIEERAALLGRLGHARDSVRARLAANLSWDFAPGRSPLSDADLDGILDRVFDKSGPPGGFPNPPATTPLGEAQLRERGKPAPPARATSKGAPR